MRNFTFGIITPSYAPDFERCQLLCESIEAFVSPVNHYIIVDKVDLLLFRSLQRTNTTIITKEELLPWWIRQIPFVKNSWLSLKTIPIRGWLLQQIIKIAMAQSIDEDIAVFVDSDVIFVRPFNFQALVQDDRVRLYHEPDGNFESMKSHLKWHHTASSLLSLPPTPMPAPDYIDHVITWKRENVVKLCQQIEILSGQSWIKSLSNAWHISEYILYGTFVDRILSNESGHYQDAQKLCHDYWGTKPMTDEQLCNFVSAIHPDHIAVMISAKAGMPVEQYRSLLLKGINHSKPPCIG
ncbi:MAG: hypothetical protein HC769_12360 [Cyanobacteria bacterium CRU_2_1]|nr:hypothetical protein [Cyanobacteria bacterium RU_5_0]NJR59566.1 hypothetical protein [Cyanobacteria bacterium CRU_2_1]